MQTAGTTSVVTPTGMPLPVEAAAAAQVRGEEMAYEMMNEAIALYLSNDTAEVPAVVLPSASAGAGQETTAAETPASVLAGFCIVMAVPCVYFLLMRLRRPRGEYVGRSAYTHSRGGRRYRR